MSDDFNQFKADAESTAEPPDGNHTATLVRAKVGASQAGDTLIILEWQTEDFAYYWTTFHGVNGGAKAFTQRLLAKLDIALAELPSWQALEDELSDREGQTYVVNVTHNGNYLNIKVLEQPQGVQTAIPVEESVPAATPVAPATSDFDDDDIPF
jgi:hypothetical protein